MEPAGDAVLRRDWHTMSPAGQQSAGSVPGLVDVARHVDEVHLIFT